MRFIATALICFLIFFGSQALPDIDNGTHYIMLALWSMLLTGLLFFIYQHVDDCSYKYDPIFIIMCLTGSYFVFNIISMIDYYKGLYIIYDCEVFGYKLEYVVQNAVNFAEFLSLAVYGALECKRFGISFKATTRFWLQLRSLQSMLSKSLSFFAISKAYEKEENQT